ncbi:hypothetical protein RUM43_010102 [Polyplax serrata]|uniref:Uncharacterized protein n=1 Tax=Polyplax serrata TaxID=468196 RepID=A0AAN8PK47_POLSC
MYDVEKRMEEERPNPCKTCCCFAWKLITCIFSHIILVSLVVAYCILGAFTFESLESGHEIKVGTLAHYSFCLTHLRCSVPFITSEKTCDSGENGSVSLQSRRFQQAVEHDEKRRGSPTGKLDERSQGIFEGVRNGFVDGHEERWLGRNGRRGGDTMDILRGLILFNNSHHYDR